MFCNIVKNNATSRFGQENVVRITGLYLDNWKVYQLIVDIVEHSIHTDELLASSM